MIPDAERGFCDIAKWFDPSKGFGFIVADGTEYGVLLHEMFFEISGKVR